MTTMGLLNFFSMQRDKTEGIVRSSVAARQKVELAADKLTRALDIIDGRMEITVKEFMHETKAARRDQTRT